MNTLKPFRFAWISIRVLSHKTLKSSIDLGWRAVNYHARLSNCTSSYRSASNMINLSMTLQCVMGPEALKLHLVSQINRCHALNDLVKTVSSCSLCYHDAWYPMLKFLNKSRKRLHMLGLAVSRNIWCINFWCVAFVAWRLLSETKYRLNTLYFIST